MATNTSIINKTGEDYDTLVLWEDATDVDLVTTSTIEIAECYVEDGDMAGCSLDGATTSTDYYRKITAAVTDRHDGTLYGGGCVVTSTGNTFLLYDAYTIIEWLIIKNTSDNGNSAPCNLDNYVTCRNNVITSGGSQGGIKGGLSQQGWIYNNTILLCPNGNGINITNSNTKPEIYNNTVYDVGGIGISIPNTSFGSVKNNLVISAVGVCYDLGSQTVATNGSSDTTGTIGLQGLTTGEFESVTGGSEDLHLAVGADSIGVGTDLGASTDIHTGYYQIDIDGRDRDDEGDVWDLGADEYVGASPPADTRRIFSIT